mgnify:CR=1 FL=1
MKLYVLKKKRETISLAVYLPWILVFWLIAALILTQKGF